MNKLIENLEKCYIITESYIYVNGCNLKFYGKGVPIIGTLYNTVILYGRITEDNQIFVHWIT